MAVNVFEGARRIVLVMHGVAALVAIGFAVLQEPFLYKGFKTTGVGRPFLLGDCTGTDSASEFVDRDTPQGSEVKVHLCFEAQLFPDGRRLVPFRVSDGTVYGNSAYSQEVSAYTKERAATFVLPPEAAQSIDGEWWRDKLEFFGYAVLGFAIWFVAAWTISWVIGWIVRGFLGIPRGQDTKPVGVPKRVVNRPGA